MSTTRKKGKTVHPKPVNKTDLAAKEKKKENEGFTAQDYEFLSENENARYLPNAKKNRVGHAVIMKDENGEEIALQYAIPHEGTGKAPVVCSLTHIEKIVRFGMTRYRAKTAEDDTVYAKRFIHLKSGDSEHEDEMDIAYFSGSEKEGKEPFWGGEKETPLFIDNVDEEDKKPPKPKVKGGKELEIDHESVWVRDANKTRKPDQNTVMGRSAKDAYEIFFNEMSAELSPDIKIIMKRAIKAPLDNVFYGNYRPEWLHAEGFSLTPTTKNPQRKNNLGAAPKWANTEMMVLERIAKWFALNMPESYIKIKPHFEMLLNSDLIKKIKFEVTIEEKNRFVTFLQSIDPFQKYPLFRKPSDLAQGTAIAHSFLKGIRPISRQKIMSAAGASATTTVSTSHTTVLPVQQPASKKEERQTHTFPTHLKYEKSIVKLIVTSQEPDYDEPWLGTHKSGCSGTGLVIAHEGKKYILTNAHCVENSVIIRARLANDRKKKYEATRKCVSYQCDLALLEVADPGFHLLAEPVQLGEMVRLQDKVQTVGFPMGGSEISISKGIVSRIEVRDYCMSGLDMLQVQVDAAINPGNSGGPVFSGDKVVGIAFQGYSRHGMGYMIPMPIIQHFLVEALSEKPYRGFPILPITLQTLENTSLRKHYGMKDNEAGLRISKVDYLCDAHSKLKVDDILLEIDSLPITNDGTVDVPNIGNCIDIVHLTHMKYIGDSVQLKILRKNTETKKIKTHLIDVILDHVPLETEKVPQVEYDKMPTYYIASGISFMPLTRNYLEGKGYYLEEYFSLEEGCSIANLPKKSPDEQIILVNDILDCEETQGYEAYENSIIKEINGKSVKNMSEVIEAIEENTNPMHCIITSSKKIIVVKNMSKKEHEVLLKRYQIHSDRSEDLLPPPSQQSQSPARSPLQCSSSLIHSLLKTKPMLSSLDALSSSSESELSEDEGEDERTSVSTNSSNKRRFDQIISTHDEEASPPLKRQKR